MSNLYELILKIQKKPSMYLGKPAISNLRSCIAGYILARRELGISQTEQEKHFTEFKSWVQEKFGVTSSQSWDKIILFYSEDERKALDRFFELFQEYLEFNHLQSKPSNYASESLIKS